MDNYLNNASFLPGRMLQISWDSHSLGVLKECPRKYYLSIILGWAPKEDSIHLTFGIYYHAAMEHYYHQKAAGISHEDALISTVDYMLRITVTRSSTDPTKWRPWYSDDPNKNRFTLVRTVVWFLDKFGEDDIYKTITLANGSPAVELSFAFEIDLRISGLDRHYMLCGRMDRIAEYAGSQWGMDFKTTKNALTPKYFRQYSPNNQMSLYNLAMRVCYSVPANGIVIDAAQILATLSRFHRGDTTRTEGQLEEWLQDTLYYIRQAEYFEANNFWPMNDKSCGNYGGCALIDICNKPKSTRDEWLASTYKRRTWDPMTLRIDI